MPSLREPGHRWDLAQKRMLLARAYAALPTGGPLIGYEALIDDELRENAFGLLMSLNMPIETKGGFDFTGADCQTCMREAGFAQTRVEPLPDTKFSRETFLELISTICLWVQVRFQTEFLRANYMPL